MAPESDSEEEASRLVPPSVPPAGKARRPKRRKKPTDGKAPRDEDDIPAMGAFGLSKGGRAECVNVVVPAAWDELSEGESTTAGSDTDMIDLLGMILIITNCLTISEGCGDRV